MKLCPCCGSSKDESEYNKKRAGLQPYCKLCQRNRARKQYLENKEQQLKTIRKGKKARQATSREYILELFKGGCVDCGITDPEVLEWDHLRDKEQLISKLLAEGPSKARLDKELAKCDLVCANCHKKRTYKRTPSYRSQFYKP